MGSRGEEEALSHSFRALIYYYIGISLKREYGLLRKEVFKMK